MRVMGFTKKWDKLSQPTFTTFRSYRRDRDWEVDEKVQVVINPRSKRREFLGFAVIIAKTPCHLVAPGTARQPITTQEAIEDGFTSYPEMYRWFRKTYGQRVYQRKLNKLTLRWIKHLTNL